MLYKCIDIPVMTAKYEAGHMVYTVSEDETFLEKRHEIYFAKGIVTANENTSLSGTMGTSKSMIQIGDTLYNVGKNDCADLLEYYVKVYYKADDDDYTLLWAYADDGKNNELYLETDDIDSFSDGVCSYDYNGQVKKAKMDKGAYYIYNGRAAALSKIPRLKPINGEVTLLDYNNDGKYDTAIIMDYISAVVDDVNKTDSSAVTRTEHISLKIKRV